MKTPSCKLSKGDLIRYLQILNINIKSYIEYLSDLNNTVNINEIKRQIEDSEYMINKVKTFIKETTNENAS
jgi:hypothetical protein